MSKKLTQQIEEYLAPHVAQLGFELCDVEYKNEDGNMVLTLFIFKDGGVSMDDCVLVNDAVDPLLDALDPIQTPYYLSISSLGIDRPFKKDRDFERYMGKDVELRLYAPFEGKKEYTGKLTGYGDSITLNAGGRDICFEKKTVALARPYVEF